ncbi:hypothetical protein DIPPA_12065 [Diplonema papillatum]|nr:hypothetical protein DIPPA_12065 [Diplonema papillatum]
MSVMQMEMTDIEILVGRLRRKWMAVKMEEAEQDPDTKEMKTHYIEVKQQIGALTAEKEVLDGELAKIEDRRRVHAKRMKGDVDSLVGVTQVEYERKQRYYDTSPQECCEILEKFCVEREQELQELYRQIEVAEREDQECKERLGELRQFAANTIPGIIEAKDRELRAIEGAWRTERSKLQQHHKELVDKQAELSWHLNRGSYIKQTPLDTRKEGQFGLKGKVEVQDNRLKIWEERLCREYVEWKDKVDDFKCQKMELSNQYERIRSDFEDRVDGKKGRPGSRPDYDDRIVLLKVPSTWSERTRRTRPKASMVFHDWQVPTTQVCLFQVRAAYVHAVTWDTAMKAAQSVRIMAKKAAEAEGLRIDWSAVFTKVHRRQGVCEVSVRVPIVDVQKLLRSSGKAGTFWKALSFVNGTDTMPAVWVSDCTLEEARRLAALTPNTFGVIAGTKTGVFGIRTTPEHVAATESAVGKKLSKRQLRGDKYVVTTACASEHATDLLAACAAAGWKVEQAGAFKRQGKTVCIVIADTGPPAPVFFRLDRASISIRKYDRSTDARQRKGFSTQCQREKVKLPPEFFASLNERPEPSPGQKRGRTEDETTESQEKLARVDGKDNMVTDCRHTSWQEAHSNAEAFLCVVCAKGMQVGQAKRLCAHGPCQAAICHACWTKSRATPPTSSPSPAQATADVPPPESQW